MIQRGLAALALVGVASGAMANVLGAAWADIRSAEGTRLGGALIPIADDPLTVRINIGHLAPGRYGAHLHAVGRCEGPDFTSAGPHWNPAGRQHGTLNSQGHHLGDLPNLEIGADGTGHLEFSIAGTGRWGNLFDADGASIVIHAAPDDYRTDPSGNSGARIACGVLRY